MAAITADVFISGFLKQLPALVSKHITQGSKMTELVRTPLSTVKFKVSGTECINFKVTSALFYNM